MRSWSCPSLSASCLCRSVSSQVSHASPLSFSVLLAVPPNDFPLGTTTIRPCNRASCMQMCSRSCWRANDLHGLIRSAGGYAGAVAQATVAICGNTSTSNVLYSEWYCKRKSMGRSIITSILPTILLMLWQNLIMPNALYRCA